MSITTERARELAVICHQNHRSLRPAPRPHDQAKLAARAAGQTKFQGSICANNHGGIRYTSTGHCVECTAMHRNNRKTKESNNGKK